MRKIQTGDAFVTPEGKTDVARSVRDGQVNGVRGYAYPEVGCTLAVAYDLDYDMWLSSGRNRRVPLSVLMRPGYTVGSQDFRPWGRYYEAEAPCCSKRTRTVVPGTSPLTCLGCGWMWTVLLDAENGELRFVSWGSGTQDAEKTPRLGPNQRSVLRKLGDPRTPSWHPRCGWLWKNMSRTVQIMKSLERRGLVEEYRPSQYALTDAGRKEVLPG